MAGETRVSTLWVEVLRSVPTPTRVSSLHVETLRAQGPSEELFTTAASVQVAIAAEPPDLTVTQEGVEVLAGGSAAPVVTQEGVEALTGGSAAPIVTQTGVEVILRANVFEGCDSGQPFYRARIRLPNASEDLVAFTSLRDGPLNFIASAPVCDASSIDVLKGTSAVGGCTLLLVDPAAGAGSIIEDGTDRAFTKWLADVSAQSQLLGARIYIEATAIAEPDEDDWAPYWAGFIATVSFPDAITAELTCAHSTRDDATTKVWATRSEWFPNTGLIAGGPLLEDTSFPSTKEGVEAVGFQGYWSMKVIGVYADRVSFDIDEDASGAFPPSDVAPYLRDRGLIRFSNNDAQRNVFSWFKRNVQPYFVEGGPDPTTRDTWQGTYSIYGWYPRLRAFLVDKNGTPFGEEFPLVAHFAQPLLDGGKPRLDKATISANLGNSFHLYWPDTSDVDQPAVDDVFTFYVRAIDVSEANPLHIVGHPVDIVTDLFDSLGIEWNAGAAATTKAALGDYVIALRITAPPTLADALAMLCGTFGFNWRFHPDGQRYLFTTRVRPELSGTIELKDLRSGDGVVWSNDEPSRVYSVGFSWQRFVTWPGQEDPKNADRAFDAVQPYDVGPIQFNTGESVAPFGARNEQYTVPGKVMVVKAGDTAPEYSEADDTEVSAILAAPILEQFARGAIVTTLDLGPCVAALEGEDWILNLPHRPGFSEVLDPVAQRGIPERVQVISRKPEPWGSRVTFVRVPTAENAINDTVGTDVPPPVILDQSLTATPSATTASLALDDTTDFETYGVQIEVAVAEQATIPIGAGTILEPLWEPPAAYTIGPFTAGAKVWYRTRIVFAAGQRGQWTAWAFTTLTAQTGVDQPGGLQTPTIALGVSVGVVSADVDGGPNAVKAYCAVSLTSFPTTVTTLAGAVDASAPFSFASLITLTPGQTAFVSVITEDANGNHSLRATALFTLPTASANAFGKIVVAGQSDVDADSTSDTLTLVAGSGITLTTTPASDQVTVTASGSGSTPQFPMLGYNTAGGSTETMTRYRVYMKKVTPANSGLLQWIGAYVNNNASNNVQNLAVAIFSDSGGAPLRLLAYAYNPDTTALLESASSTPVARWLSVPISVDLVGGTDYWIAVMNSSPTLGTIAYDGSGTDKYFTSGGSWFADAGFYTVNTSTNKYSIRARMLEGTLL